jgi:tetratricopeptide (TPR) repeat protein
MIDSVSYDSGLQECDGTGATAPHSADAVRDVSTRDQPRLFKQLQAGWESLPAFSVKLGAIFTIFTIALIFALLVHDITQWSMNIDPISVPKALSDDGYTPTVVAQKLRDKINEIIADAQTTMKNKEDVALQQERPDIMVPGVGISIDTIAGAISGFLPGLRQDITGEFTSSRGELRLQLRIDDIAIFSDRRGIVGSPDALLRASARDLPCRTQPSFVAAVAYRMSPSAPDDEASAVDALLRAAAREVLCRTQPYFVAAAAYKTSPSAAYDEATAIIDKLPRTDEQVARAYNLRGLIRTDEQVARAYNLRGLILADRNKYEDAEAQYVEAFLLDTSLESARYNLGNLLQAEYRSQAKYRLDALITQYSDMAIIQYNEALRLDPYDADTHVALGELFMDRRDDDHALGEFREAIRVDPFDKYAHNALGDLLRRDISIATGSAHQREVEAEAEYRTAIRLDPQYPDPHDGLGNVRVAESDGAGAEQEFRTFVRLAPTQAAAHDEIASFLFQEHRYKEAIEHYKAAIMLARKDADAYNGLASALLFANADFKGAFYNYSRAIQPSSGWADPHFNYASALVKEFEADRREHAAADEFLLLEACRELRVGYRLASRDGRVAKIAQALRRAAIIAQTLEENTDRWEFGELMGSGH